MFLAAQLCANEGKIPQAIRMLHMSLDVCSTHEGSTLHPRLRRDDYDIVRTILSTEVSSTAPSNAEISEISSQVEPVEGQAAPPSPSPPSPPPLVSRNSMGSSSKLVGGTTVTAVDMPLSVSDRMVLVQMLLMTGDLERWADVLAALLVSSNDDDDDEVDLILRCLVQLLENRSLIDAKPIAIGKQLLTYLGAEDWAAGRLMAIKKRGIVDEAGNTMPTYLMTLGSGELFNAEKVLPFGSEDAGAILRAAAGMGHAKLITTLLEADVHPMSADKQAVTPLELAVRNGHVKCAKVLLATQVGGGATSVHYVNAAGFRPLDYAMISGNPEMRTTIIQSQVYSEVQAALDDHRDGHISLQLLAMAHDDVDGHTQKQDELMVSLEAEPRFESTGGVTTAMLAAYYGYSQPLMSVLRGKVDPLQCTHKHRCSAMTMAAENGHVDAVRQLLGYVSNPPVEQGPEDASESKEERLSQLINHQSAGGVTPLLLACQNAHEKVTRVLLQAGAIVDPRLDDGQTPLIMAARTGFLAGVSLLLRAGANDRLVDADGMSALTVSARFGHHEVAGEIAMSRSVQAKAGVLNGGDGGSGDDTQGAKHSELPGAGRLGMLDEVTGYVGKHSQQTALILACRYGHDQVVHTLLRHHADVTCVDSAGMTALMWASKGGHEPLLPFLLAASRRSKNSLNKTVTTAQYLSIRDRIGMTALMHACLAGQADVASVLVNEGADVFLQRDDGMTALMLASVSGAGVPFLEILQIEKERPQAELPQLPPATLSQMSRAGAERARAYLRETMTKRARLRHRAKLLDAQDHQGMTALMHAASNGCPAMVRGLLQAGADRYLVNDDERTAQMLAFILAQSQTGQAGSGEATVREFHDLYRTLHAHGPPLLALRAMANGEHSKNALVGVGSLVFDSGTGGGKLICWLRLDQVKFYELTEVKIKGFSWADAIAQGHGHVHDPSKMQPLFKELTEQLGGSLDKVRDVVVEIDRIRFTKFFLGATAWYRQMSPDVQQQAFVFMNALAEHLSRRLKQHDIECPVEFGAVSALDESQYESKAVAFALNAQKLEPPLALVCGGMGSVQLSGLDGHVSFDMPLKTGLKMVETAPSVPEGLAQWTDAVQATVAESELKNQLNQIAARSQDEGGEPVRLVLISSFFYLGMAANLVSKATKSINYIYQPLQVILDAVKKVRDDPNGKLQDRANAIRLYVLLNELFDPLYHTRVECLLARDWQLGGTDKDDFRTTWSGGWWLDHLVGLYQAI